MGEGYRHRCGSSSRLQGRLDERGPDDRRRGRGSCSSLDAVRTVSHFPVVLHDLLDDLTLLVVEDARVEVVLHFVQEDGILLTWTPG